MKCRICRKELSGYGNNPDPAAENGRRCGLRNAERVIPAGPAALYADSGGRFPRR